MTQKLLAALGVALALAGLGTGNACANVQVTPASGGTGLSADTAANAVSPAWTALGPITISEAANGDFSSGTNVTLVLKAPAGFQFNAAQTPDVSFTAGQDISAASVSTFDATNISVSLT